MEATAQEAAQVLEDAADWLLVNGRCRDDLTGPHGEGCVMEAICNVIPGEQYDTIDNPIAHLAWKALTAHVGGSPVHWNLHTADDDEVRDTLLLVAKELRA